MKTRTKTLGVAAAVAAITASLPLAATASADPAPTTTTAPVVEIPDPQGSGCDNFKKAIPEWKNLAELPAGKVLASIPDISTFNAALSGGMNPDVNIIPVLDNGPYVIFAPTNDAFAAMEPGKLDALKADSAALTSFDYYHAFLGLLGPDDVKGQRPTQQGAEVKVTGKGGDIKVNDTAKLVCGPIQAQNARIYLIDTVLDPNSPPEELVPTITGTSTTTTTKAPETPAADAPIG
ncbi:MULTISPECIES: fasciclin domain-containing protein [Mycolicibacterium]|uniref:Beta-Ig-H3/fasciclin n=1 Tax=Mycolicibacterium senegalense TaxID=1796 RepID=A0A378SXB5_9MYCO|nr:MULTISPECIES: fasciclin domain-containing protein [Mycolicibacterium]MCV7334689.1 fasciclin domain-containing protein [Mycolicibacterium senegalense]MDR7291839.1 putative surface protein with fasciclin (FAS1) repeats [Mycolicibacterium senegalense]QZA23277.1 fasciclin domain-containing protein [Mycolicibacterium senegalense]CDP89769.1 fasciclin domain-containing protein [Mycolicibacterium farcinogenes]STZ53159.1 beta-Ig-H3/fasciclin [Mycolicibacterium senegalense]